jgi:alpha-beta hydrolase superfamily lysophospholipase
MPSPPNVQTREVATPTGGRLFVTTVVPAEHTRDLMIVHGYGEHGGRYIERAHLFAEHGFRVTIPDMRGHGRSAGQRGYVRCFGDYVADVRFLFDRLHADPTRTALLGHSNGGLIAAGYLADAPGHVCCGVLTSPLLGIAVDPPAWKKQAGHILSRVLPVVSLPSEIRPEWLSHDAHVVSDYRSDPLNHHVNNARWYTEALRMIERVFERGASISLPLLVLQAGDDRLVSPAAARRWASLPPNATYEEVAGAYHELLFETDGPQHAQRILSFLDAQIPPNAG